MENRETLFSDKAPKNQNITLLKNNCIISEDEEVAATLNHFFEHAIDSLDISENEQLLTDTGELINPVEISIKKFEKHPSVGEIKDNIKASKFSFSEIILSDIETELKSLKGFLHEK